MAVIDEIIRVEGEGAISFGDYLVAEKKKCNDFSLNGSLYKVKTHQAITRLEKDGELLLETVPGATVHKLAVTDEKVTFDLEGIEDTRVTLALVPDVLYRIVIEHNSIGNVRANVAGKIVFSLDLDNTAKSVEIIKN